MENKKVKWLIYTVLVGLRPVLCRLLICLVTKSGTVARFNAAEFVAFGLILHISNINEIEHIKPITQSDGSWKTTQNGISILFISFYSVLFALTLLSGSPSSNVNHETITYCTMLLSFVSFLLSYSVYHRVSKLSMEA